MIGRVVLSSEKMVHSENVQVFINVVLNNFTPGGHHVGPIIDRVKTESTL